MNTVFQKLVLSIGVVLLAASCVREIGIDEKPDTTTDHGRARVTLEVNVPSHTNLATRATNTAFENDINTLVLYIATDTDSDGVFHLDSLVVIDPEEVMLDGLTGRFTMEMPVSNTPVKFIALANMNYDSYSSIMIDIEDANEAGVAYNPYSTTKPEVEAWKTSRTIDIFPDDWAGMPMAGEATVERISPRQYANLHIPLLRAVAKADLRLALGVDSKSFEPKTVTVYRQTMPLYHAAAAAAYDSGGTRVIAPSFANIPDSRTATTTTTITATDLAETTFYSAYLPEAIAPAADKQTSDATCMVVGGNYNGSSTTTYYRIDFNSGIDGHPFGQILRNWHYIFNITRVSAPGYADADAALANPSNAITIEVEMWDENVQQVNFVSTGDYMFVNENDIELAYSAGSNNTFVVRSTLPFEWQIDDGPKQSSEDIVLYPLASNDKYIVTIALNPTSSGDGYTDYKFTVTSLTDNTTSGNKNEAAVFLYVDNAILSVKITQKSMSVTDRKVHVLSLTNGLGSMGVYYNETGSSSTASNMKTILLNKTYFGPTGMVKFGGFTMEQYQEGSMASTATNVSLDRLERMLEPADIVIVPYAADPPQKLADAIVKWAQKPYHVLFLMCDSGMGTTTGVASNVTIRNSLQDGITWYPITDMSASYPASTAVASVKKDFPEAYLQQISGISSSVSASFEAMIMDTPNEINAPFMAGVFGAPDQGMASNWQRTNYYRWWDDIASWGQAPSNPNIVPLQVAQVNVWPASSSYNAAKVTKKTRGFLSAVDVQKTVVYIGECQLWDGWFYTTPQYDATGQTGTPYFNSNSMLMSNIWAWAVKNVLAQVKEED